MSWQIAIDGPAAAGKSTIAKIIANNLGFEYLDTGAMYRAATVKALRLGFDLFDESKYDFILSTKIDFRNGDIYLDDENVSEEIRTLEVSNNVSVVCKYKIVRDRMVELQREMANSKNIVMDGRDIGTVVLPNANVKIFLIASPEERARRRMVEREQKGNNTQTLEETIVEICERDRKDSTREISPLKKACDAIEIDSSHLSINEVVEMITQLVRERGWNMEDVKQVNEVAEETAEETNVAEEVTVAESQEEKAKDLKELQLVEGVVTGQIESKPEKTDKDGNIKRSFRSPKEDDWNLLKVKTENDILNSDKTVGCYIYDNILQNPQQKIIGKLVRTIERKFYKEELGFSAEKVLEDFRLLSYDTTSADSPTSVISKIKYFIFCYSLAVLAGVFHIPYFLQFSLGKHILQHITALLPNSIKCCFFRTIPLYPTEAHNTSLSCAMSGKKLNPTENFSVL